MLETAEERVKLLKTGASGKEIEMLYIEHNNFKIIRKPILYEAKEFDIAHSIFDNEGYFENTQMSHSYTLLSFPPLPHAHEQHGKVSSSPSPPRAQERRSLNKRAAFGIISFSPINLLLAIYRTSSMPVTPLITA